MNRSAIEDAIVEARFAFAAAGLRLPPFAEWSAEDWQRATTSHAVVEGCGRDMTGHLFAEPMPRFPTVEEDGPATQPLVSDWLR